MSDSAPGAPNPAAGESRPSIRLTLSTSASSSAAASSSANKAASPAPPTKKRKTYTPVNLVPDTASVANLTLLHQQTSLHACLHQDPARMGTTTRIRPHWHLEGRTTLYVIRAADEGGDANNTSATMSLALHLRSTCVVTDVSVASLGSEHNNETSPLLMHNLRTSYHHADPLQHVLIKPPASYTAVAENNATNSTTSASSTYRFNADAQSSRGAVGMTTALRVASIASNLGELRISTERPNNEMKQTDTQVRQRLWKQELKTIDKHQGAVLEDMRKELHQGRCHDRRDERLDHVAKLLAEAGSSALKVTVSYRIALDQSNQQSHGSNYHLGGLHVLAQTTTSPHVYTTTGVYGDHEGPRTWVPCCDSASVSHRATQEWNIQLTAPMSYGLSVVGAGEDMGESKTMLLHKGDWNVQEAITQLGKEHVNMLQRIWESPGTANVHVIPMESTSTVESLASIQATVVWSSASWTPIPVRSLGFAIGPFKAMEDSEYFGISTFIDAAAEGDDDDDDDEDSGDGATKPTLEEKHLAFVEAARKNGEGIRQVYFAALHERKFIHEHADRMLLPKTKILLTPLTDQQKEISAKFDQTVTYPTVGVPHRALSLMRDVLALPAFRTVSYTQIWIPDAVHGGASNGALNCCPEVLVNPFLGGAIMDSRLLPPMGSVLPFYAGGRVLQFLQARSAIRGWILAALPLGGRDDVGNGYIHSTVESFLMSLYERGYGAYGEGGAKGGTFFNKRFAGTSGLNSPNLDFLPVQNIEDLDTVGGVGAVPVEDRHNDQLWRSYTNGTESHTASVDEYNTRQLLIKDCVEAIERGTEKDAGVPHPSMGWFGSHLSLTFLSSNATTSSDLGCGAVEMQHPMGGLVYRSLKSDVFRSVVEGRAGVANFIRLVRVAFIAAHLDDIGEAELRLSALRDSKADKDPSSSTQQPDHVLGVNNPPFVVCVNEVIKKKGLSHNLFTRALQNLSGPLREHLLTGSLVDVERLAEDPRTGRPFVEPEGFPNSYVRGASLLYCRIGVHVEMAKDSSGSQAQTAAIVVKGVQMQAYAEPVIPEGGIAFGGPVTMRIVENEGQFREYVKDLDTNGSRRDWGATFLHAKPVTTVKTQTAASGAIEGEPGESKDATKTSDRWASAVFPSLETCVPTKGFSEDNFHVGGYQAIELIRLTNLSPLLWVRVDPAGIFGGRISVVQPDACLSECLYHDGDAAAQVDSMRALAERPLRIQTASKVTTVYDANVAELPVRVIGDCLRASAAAHSSLPHTPVVRSQAALALAQWQNNKAPKSKDDIGADNWVGLSLLFQYFRERFYSNGVIMPAKFSRLAVKKSEAETQAAANAVEGGTSNTKNDDGYQYLDSLVQGEERAALLDDSEDIELEEDEEYRVRSQVVAAIASIRANDGQTPSSAISFLEAILEADNAEMVGHLIYPDEELVVEQALRRLKNRDDRMKDDDSDAEDDDKRTPSLSYVSSILVAESLLALCHVNASPNIITDPKTGKPIPASDSHPVSKLIEIARSWLDWELYREKIREEILARTATGISGNCHNMIASSAILALVNLTILRQCTSDSKNGLDLTSTPVDGKAENGKANESSTAKFYIDIFDHEYQRNDLTRAACAQAIACIYCATDRFTSEPSGSIGLLRALEFLLERITDERTSPSLRQTLALIMMDASTGKVCSMQRVGAIGGRNDLVASASRFLNGPLGASHGGDNGSAVLTTVSPTAFPAASAVNDGARRGLRLLSRAGHPKETVDQATIVRVARFATRLWRTLNGEPTEAPSYKSTKIPNGVCAYDGALRCSLLALWQWIWPKGCFAVLAVQSWNPEVNLERYKELGAHEVMQTTEEEKAEGAQEESVYEDINGIVSMELDRQAWRGEMSRKAYDMFRASKQGSMQDVAKAEQGIGQPLPPIERDAAFRQGGWIASAAQQRRRLALDGGGAVTKLRLTVKNTSET